MNIWILTIGSSDVQLESDKKNRENGRTEKQRSHKVWSEWYDEAIKEECHDILFEPKQSYKDSDESYRVEARVLGTVYELSSLQVRDEIWSYLTFPLLDNFVRKFTASHPDAIAILLTDQSEFFKDKNTRRKPKCAYWQDTCKLEPILQRYFQDKFPQAQYKPILLSPTSSDKGLDDWNYVLDLVREKLRAIEFDGQEIKNEEIKTVYVSHQAGTPAISSAVQFVSLASFRTNVQFLVSNEYSQQTRTISRSTYLGAIQRQEAKALLERHDYAGVRDILGLTNISQNNPKEKRIKDLLDAGEQWNFAEFQKFKKILADRKLLPVHNFPWYQSGFESIYLAWVRFEQGSTVDALFHSFRAAEGSITKWAEKRYSSHIIKKGDLDYNSKYGSQLKFSICQELPNYLDSLSESHQKNFHKWQKIGLFGVPLYELLKQARPDWQNHPDIKVVWEVAKDERNNLFHRLEGLQKLELFEAWNTDNKADWKKRILGCINFIAQGDLSQEFTSLEEASLMAKVHKELVEAIAPNNFQT